MHESIYIVHLSDLLKMNENSIKRGYNRNFCEDIIVEYLQKGCDENGVVFSDGLKLVVQFMMLHHHKNGEECEEHIRLMVYLVHNNRFAFLDVTKEDFEAYCVPLSRAAA